MKLKQWVCLIIYPVNCFLFLNKDENKVDLKLKKYIFYKKGHFFLLLFYQVLGLSLKSHHNDAKTSKKLVKM
jgi:hypothetical protein